MSLVAAAYSFRAALEEFDPEVCTPEGCAVAVSALARVERLCRLKKAQAALRAIGGGAHGRDGSPDGAHWLAAQSGESVTAAKHDIATVDGLSDCPHTAAAVAAGELSLDQAREITAAEAANPGSEQGLLAVAATAPFHTLRQEARKKRHAGIDAEELHRRQVAARRFRSWTNEVGNIAFAGEVPPEVGVPFINRLDADTDRRWRAARKTATRGDALARREAYAADALMAMTAGRGGGDRRSTEAVVVIDLRAWRRGHAEDGEVCHIIGGGRIPVRVARELAADAFFKAVIHDGANILTVCHFGRKMSAELRTALELGRAPMFDGVTCCDSACGRRHGLEWDHDDPVANGGATRISNLKARCKPHHQQKTERDRAAGLLNRRDFPP